MCGVAGLLDLRGQPIEPRSVAQMIDLLRHRGPDGEGVWAEGQVGLGHRRLAIIDTSSAGLQPMISSSGRYVITYNGEIYNFRELRLELEKTGTRFVSNSDTEVVLEALAAWGPRVIERFNGMFAFALWDRLESRLLLARDRYGIKPLYWSLDQGKLAFASENKAILAVDARKRDLDRAALAEYLTFQNFFSDKTLLSGINLFPAGHFATFHADSAAAGLKFTQYWDFAFSSSRERIGEEEQAEELRRLLRQAVERQLVSDVEIGAYLSGGIDSGSTTSIASQSIPDLKSFTCGFDLSSASGLELGFDERRAAEELSALFRTEHYEMVLKAGDMERCMPLLTWHLEEPRVGQSYPNFYASKLAGRFVKVVLSGTGGDEIFGGYPWRYFHIDKAATFGEYVNNYYLYWQRLLNDDERTRLLGRTCSKHELDRPRELFMEILARRKFASAGLTEQLNSALYLEAKTFLHGLLVVEDKLSMAHSLETRVPFLDNDLVDFALRCPPDLKVDTRFLSPRLDENTPGIKVARDNGQSVEGKQLLRRAAHSFLPIHVVDARKQGFSAPDASWFRGDSISYVERRLLGGRSRFLEFVDRQVMERLVAEHLTGKKNRRLLIWSLLSLESWLEAYQ